VAARAVLTARNVPAERSGAAALDRAHHLQLMKAHMTCIGATPGRSEVAENIRNLLSRTRQESRRLCRCLVLASLALHLVRDRQPIERTVDSRDQARGDARVARRHLQLLMSEQGLDRPDIDAAIEQMGCKGVAQRMEGELFLIPAASTVSWNRRLTWRGVRCHPFLRPENSQRSSTGTPASYFVRAHLPPDTQQLERLR
jgi:hypothetical protein